MIAAAQSSSIHVSLGQVAASLALVALAAAVSFWWKADLERDIGIAAIRSLVQLTAIGYAIQVIFDADTIWLEPIPASNSQPARETRDSDCWLRSIQRNTAGIQIATCM